MKDGQSSPESGAPWQANLPIRPKNAQAGQSSSKPGPSSTPRSSRPSTEPRLARRPAGQSSTPSGGTTLFGNLVFGDEHFLSPYYTKVPFVDPQVPGAEFVCPIQHIVFNKLLGWNDQERAIKVLEARDGLEVDSVFGEAARLQGRRAEFTPEDRPLIMGAIRCRFKYAVYGSNDPDRLAAPGLQLCRSSPLILSYCNSAVRQSSLDATWHPSYEISPGGLGGVLGLNLYGRYLMEARAELRLEPADMLKGVQALERRKASSDL